METSSPSTMVICPECGPATVSHGIERWKARFEIVMGVLIRPPEIIWAWIKPGASSLRPGRMGPTFARVAAALRLGKILDKPDEHVNDRTRVTWEEARRRGMVMYEFRPFGLPRELFWATYRWTDAGGKIHADTRAFDGLPRPREAHETSINWMDNKGTILEKFRRAGVPMPRGRACRTIAQAEKVFYSIHNDAAGVAHGNIAYQGAVIVKPAIGSRSRHTYVNITDIATLRDAFIKAKQLSPYVVVEEEIPGFVFRITLVGGKPVGVMRREPPHVMGDGVHTVRELVEKENENPLRHGPIFHTLELGPEAEEILKTQKNIFEAKNFAGAAGDTPPFDAVPQKGAMVVLHPKVSRSFGASNTEMASAEIHPENKKIFAKIAAVLDDPLVGVDFIIEDMSRPWQDQKCGVIECNSLPFIDLHHFPLKGTPVNVAGMVWDLVFPASNPERN